MKDIFTNNISTTVAASKTAPAQGTSESWTVASSTGFPAALSTAKPATQFTIIDPAATGELMRVTNVSGTTWTVIRGADGTTPVTHASGFTVAITGAAAYLNAATPYINIATATTSIGTGATDLTGLVVDNLPAGTYTFKAFVMLTSTGGATVDFTLSPTGAPTTTMCGYTFFCILASGNSISAVKTAFNSASGTFLAPLQLYVEGAFTSSGAGKLQLSGIRAGGTTPTDVVQIGSYIQVTPVTA